MVTQLARSCRFICEGCRKGRKYPRRGDEGLDVESVFCETIKKAEPIPVCAFHSHVERFLSGGALESQSLL